MEKEYDVLVVGPVSLDHNIDYLGNERSEVGGAVVASGWAAAGSGASGVKSLPLPLLDEFRDLPSENSFGFRLRDVFWGDNLYVDNPYLTSCYRDCRLRW